MVEVTCLLSALSGPSVSSPVERPGEAFVFFLRRLDLHWISVSRPVGTDGGFTTGGEYLQTLILTAGFQKSDCSLHLVFVCVLNFIVFNQKFSFAIAN